MPIYALGADRPQIHNTAYIAPGAQVVGRVALAADTTVWLNAVLRGDNDLLQIGAGSNIQDGAVLHADPGFPITVGERVTIGHQAMVHGCTIEDESLIGIQAIILNGAQIGTHCIIGAGALITAGTVIPAGSMVLGSPGKIVRSLRPDEIEMIQSIAKGYVARGERFRSNCQEMTA